MSQLDGVLVLNKPSGLTSAACIARIKRAFGQKKIGHAGTLDPMAQGVLLVLLGQGTKISGHLMDAGLKVYSGSIRLGVQTDTWDMEGAIQEERPCGHVTAEAVQEAMKGLVGTYTQEVPAYSAAKHEGRPLYALARKGMATPVKSKVVTVFRGEAELVGLPIVRFRVECSSGTYVRSLAHSLGMRLGCGAALAELIREYSHPFGLDRAVSLETLQSAPEGFAAHVAAIADALPDWPLVCASSEEEGAVRNGNPVAFARPGVALVDAAPFVEGQPALLQREDGRPLALVQSARKNGQEVWAIVRGLWN